MAENRNTIDRTIKEFGYREIRRSEKFQNDLEEPDPDAPVEFRMRGPIAGDIESYRDCIHSWVSGIFSERPIEEAPEALQEEITKLRNKEQ